MTKTKRKHEEGGGLLKSLLGIRRDGGKDPDEREDLFSDEEYLGEEPEVTEDDELGGTDDGRATSADKHAPDTDLNIPSRWGIFLQVSTKKNGPILYDPDYFFSKVADQLQADFDTAKGRDKVFEAVNRRISGGTVTVVVKYCDAEGNPILDGDPVEEANAKTLISALDRRYQAAVLALKAKEEAQRPRRQAEPAPAPAPAPASGLTESDWAMFEQLPAAEQEALLAEYKDKMTMSEVLRMKTLILKSKNPDPPPPPPSGDGT